MDLEEPKEIFEVTVLSDKMDVSKLMDYKSFFEECLSRNKPSLVKIENGHWESAKKWVKNGKPCFQFLRDHFGSTSVPVADCKKQRYNAQEKAFMNLEDYLDYWESYIHSGYNNTLPCLYLKDWHFFEEFPDEYFYEVPIVFSSDWLNEYCMSRSDLSDYRFVYMGPKGTWTPFHADVFSSFSWSINICGRKRWIIYPPGDEDYFRDKFGQLAYDITDEKVQDITQFPNSAKAKPLTVYQEVGEAIFIPSGWHHQVWNIEDTISINHNWVNGCNILEMWNSLKKSILDVRSEIADCVEMDGWDEQCQLMLKSLFGMDFVGYYDFLKFITERRLESLIDNKQNTFGKKHVVFDLCQLRNVLQIILFDIKDQMLDSSCELRNNVINLLETIVLEIGPNKEDFSSCY